MLATLQDLKFKVKKFEQTSKTVYFLINVFEIIFLIDILL